MLDLEVLYRHEELVQESGVEFLAMISVQRVRVLSAAIRVSSHGQGQLSTKFSHLDGSL